jgi:hypothetical protein
MLRIASLVSQLAPNPTERRPVTVHAAFTSACIRLSLRGAELEEPTPLHATELNCQTAMIGNKAPHFALLAGVGKNAKRVGAPGCVTLLHANKPSFVSAFSPELIPIGWLRSIRAEIINRHRQAQALVGYAVAKTS